MGDKMIEIVKQHIAGAAAQHHTEGGKQNHVVEQREAWRGPLSPQEGLLGQTHAEFPAEHQAADIGQRIPADHKRTDADQYGIDGGKGDHEKRHSAGSMGAPLRCPLWRAFVKRLRGQATQKGNRTARRLREKMHAYG